MSRLVKAIRVWQWIQGEERHTELSCSGCDHNFKMISDAGIKEPVQSVIECPRCKNGMLLNEQPDNELVPFAGAGNKSRYYAEIRI